MYTVHLYKTVCLQIEKIAACTVQVHLHFQYMIGSSIFTINPTNVTTCLGSPAVFTCVITESLPILWLINGTSVQSPPPSTSLTPGPGSQSTLSVTATSELNGAPVQCYYTPSVLLPSIVSPPAYLSVQGL